MYKRQVLPDVKVDYELGPEWYPAEKGNEVLKNGKLTVSSSMNLSLIHVCMKLVCPQIDKMIGYSPPAAAYFIHYIAVVAVTFQHYHLIDLSLIHISTV